MFCALFAALLLLSFCTWFEWDMELSEIAAHLNVHLNTQRKPLKWTAYFFIDFLVI